MSDCVAYLESRRSRFLEDLLGFLRIPSISALPDHAGDVQRAAEWVAQRLQAAGITNVRVMPTGGHPVVFGQWLEAPRKPTVLIYGHFDVQPVDPLDEWRSPPFEPDVRDDRIYARGASDNKGNMLAAIIAVEALLKTNGSLPVNVKFLFEGQEEIGSPQLPDFVANNKKLLACDVVLNADSGQWSESEPVLAMGVRGLCALEIDVRSARSDLHSGGFGGAIHNPIHVLADIIASLHSPDGSVAVAGFYDDVAPTSDQEREQIAAVPHDDAEFLAQVGAGGLCGEPGYSTLERLWVRPTLEVNGMWGGFQGEGIKTVLPCQAHAKISCRLVPNQRPEDIQEKVRAHIERVSPAGVEVTVRLRPSGANPYVVPAEHPGNQAARAVLVEMYGREPYFVRGGGTVPALSTFHKNLGADTIGFGFGLNDEQVHAPNEFFRLASFTRAQEGWCRLLTEIASGATQPPKAAK